MTLLLALQAAAAGSVSVSLSASPSPARPGDTVTVSVNLHGVSAAGGVAAGGVTVGYDASALTYQSASVGGGKPSTDLDVNAAGGTIKLLYLDNSGGSNGFSSDGVMASIKFKVNNVAPGSISFMASADGFGNKSASPLSASAAGITLTIAAPLSGNTSLAALTVSNAQITPAFSAGTTGYTASVPFSVSKLEVTASAADSGATVSVNSPALTPGGQTNVTVTVTAPSGAKQIYTIAVTRAPDPNYVPDANNTLQAINLNIGILSPPFSADITEYVVWLPYESTSIQLTGTPQSALASAVTAGGDTLQPGQDNVVTITCAAEDGSTKVYTITVKRAAANGEAANATDNTGSTTADVTAGATDVQSDVNKAGGIPTLVFVIGLVAALAAGGAGGFFIANKAKH